MEGKATKSDVNGMCSDLIRWSFRFVWRHKTLLLPLVVVVAALAVQFWLGRSFWPEAQRASRSTFWRELRLFPLTACGVAICFFATGVITGAIKGLYEGAVPTLGDGLCVARDRWKALLGWSIGCAVCNSATGLILNRGGWVNQLTYSIASLAWIMATYFVIPILVAEECGASDALRRSAALLGATWLHQLRSFFSFGWRFSVILLVSVVPAAMAWKRTLLWRFFSGS